MKKITLLMLVAMVAFATSPTIMAGSPESLADYEFATDAMDAVPTTGGSHDGWGEWFVTAFENDTGEDVQLQIMGFPCCGTGDSDPNDGWLVWTDVGGMNAPSGAADTRDFGGQYTPVDQADDTFPPVTYTYVDITSENIVIPAGNFFAIGYDVIGNGGQIDVNGHETWGWYGGAWDADSGYSRTALIQVTGTTSGSTIEEVTWGQIKEL